MAVDTRDSDLEDVHADPVMVDRLVKSMAIGLQTAIQPGVTTQADILSAVFTVLYRMLNTARQDTDPHEQQKNAAEIGRVLQGLLMDFGAITKH